MNIGDIINDSIKYPSVEWTKNLILGVILIIPIVNFIGVGYLFRIIKATFAGIDDLPDFDEMGELFIDGLKILIVGIIYAIPIVIIALIFSLILNLLGFGSYNTTADISSGAMIAALIGSVVYLVAAIIVGLVEVMAIANMALYEGELGAAFKFSEILDRIAMIGWGKYIGWYIIMALIGLVVYVISIVLGVITIGIGLILVILLIAPYFSMFSARSLALLFASSEEDPEPVE